MSRVKNKPLYDWSEPELIARLREMYRPGSYVHSPNDIVRELERKAAVRQAKVAIATSIVSAATATLAVILSAVAVLGGR
jgi:hypothetical protein